MHTLIINQLNAAKDRMGGLYPLARALDYDPNGLARALAGSAREGTYLLLAKRLADIAMPEPRSIANLPEFR